MKLAKTLALTTLAVCCINTQPAQASDFVKNLLQQFSGTVASWDDLAARRQAVETQIRQAVRGGTLNVTDADQLQLQLRPIDDALVQGRASGKPLSFSQGVMFAQKLNSVTAALQQAVATRQSTLPDVDALQSELAQKIDEALSHNQLTREDAQKLKGQLATVADIESTIKGSGDGQLSPKQIETLSTRLSDIKTQLVQAIKMGESALPELSDRGDQLQRRIDRAAADRRISRDQASELSAQLDASAQKRNSYSNGGLNLNGRQILELAGDLDRVSAKLETYLAASNSNNNNNVPVTTAPVLPSTPVVQTQVTTSADTDGGAYNPSDNTVKYKDVTGYWGEPYVSTLASRGILGGFPDGTFHPNDNITRAQFAAIAVKALSVPPNTGSSSFNDVSPKYWASAAIGAVSNAGLVTGFPDGTFKPEDKLTRAQALVILAKALASTTGGGNFGASEVALYSDASTVPAWALPSVTRAAGAHIIASFPDASAINPNALATRGEVAALMYQTLLALHKPLPRITIGLLPQFASGATTVVNVPASQPQQQAPAAEGLRIDSVEVSPSGKLAAGDVLMVRAVGTPGAQASFSIREGIQDVPMDERRDGVYQGSYTVRKSDNIGRTRVSVALTKDGAQAAAKQSRNELMIDALPPEVMVDPRPETRVDASQANIVVKFSDGHGSGVDPTSVHLIVNNQDVTGQAIVDNNMVAFKPTTPLAGPVTAQIKLADKCGNAVDYSWTFRVGSGGAPGANAGPDNNQGPGRGFGFGPGQGFGQGQGFGPGRGFGRGQGGNDNQGQGQGYDRGQGFGRGQ